MKNVLLEAIETRRSVCRYREERLPPAQPNAVPETSTDAPTENKLQLPVVIAV